MWSCFLLFLISSEVLSCFLSPDTYGLYRDACRTCTGPGGFSSIIALAIAGRLVTRVNPKWLLAFGIFTAALSTYMMSLFNLSADFITVMWPRIILGVGMGFIFIPLTNLTLSTISRKGWGMPPRCSTLSGALVKRFRLPL